MQQHVFNQSINQLISSNLGEYHVQRNKTSRTARTMISLIAHLETCEYELFSVLSGLRT